VQPLFCKITDKRLPPAHRPAFAAPAAPAAPDCLSRPAMRHQATPRPECCSRERKKAARQDQRH
jgi:hypothetical protein